jgi:hypothetical protein
VVHVRQREGRKLGNRIPLLDQRNVSVAQ